MTFIARWCVRRTLPPACSRALSHVYFRCLNQNMLPIKWHNPYWRTKWIARCPTVFEYCCHWNGKNPINSKNSINITILVHFVASCRLKRAGTWCHALSKDHNQWCCSRVEDALRLVDVYFPFSVLVIVIIYPNSKSPTFSNLFGIFNFVIKQKQCISGNTKLKNKKNKQCWFLFLLLQKKTQYKLQSIWCVYF